MVKACGLTLMAMLAGASATAAQQAQQDFPEGPGKQTFMQVCGACHDINRARAGYTPQGWRTVMQMMVNFDGAGPQDQIGTLTEYLIKSFPERPRPPAVLIDGPVQAWIKLWQVPTPGSRPHDPLATRDGSIWYTGQMTNKLGRVDPKNRSEQGIHPQDAAHRAARPGRGQGRQYLVHRQSRRSGRQARPEDRRGHRIQDAGSQGASDPHSLAIDPSGNVWFTAQQSNVVGRVDPKTGEVKLVTGADRTGRGPTAS